MIRNGYCSLLLCTLLISLFLFVPFISARRLTATPQNGGGGGNGDGSGHSRIAVGQGHQSNPAHSATETSPSGSVPKQHAAGAITSRALNRNKAFCKTKGRYSACVKRAFKAKGSYRNSLGRYSRGPGPTTP